MNKELFEKIIPGNSVVIVCTVGEAAINGAKASEIMVYGSEDDIVTAIGSIIHSAAERFHRSSDMSINEMILLVASKAGAVAFSGCEIERRVSYEAAATRTH